MSNAAPGKPEISSFVALLKEHPTLLREAKKFPDRERHKEEGHPCLRCGTRALYPLVILETPEKSTPKSIRALLPRAKTNLWLDLCARCHHELFVYLYGWQLDREANELLQ